MEYLLSHIEFIAGVIGIFGFLVAIRAFNLQKKEIVKNGRIATLTHASNLLQIKIDHNEKIIADLKLKNNGLDEWVKLADKVNKELRPAKSEIDCELLDLLDDDNLQIDVLRVKELISNKKA